jgi:hypothetical protein
MVGLIYIYDVQRLIVPNKPLEWKGHQRISASFITPCLPLRGSVRLTDVHKASAD